jgi:hypothetical protein
MRTAIVAVLAAISIVSIGATANATQWAYTRPANGSTCPAGSFFQPAHYGHHTHWVNARCAFGPR